MLVCSVRHACSGSSDFSAHIVEVWFKSLSYGLHKHIKVAQTLLWGLNGLHYYLLSHGKFSLMYIFTASESFFLTTLPLGSFDMMAKSFHLCSFTLLAYQ